MLNVFDGASIEQSSVGKLAPHNIIDKEVLPLLKNVKYTMISTEHNSDVRIIIIDPIFSSPPDFGQDIILISGEGTLQL